MTNYTHTSEYFFGQKISQYGLENGYIDYRTLASTFECILNNQIMKATTINGDEWYLENGSDVQYYDTEKEMYIDYEDIEEWDHIEEYYSEIFQYYIIDNNGARILKEYTDELVYYNEELDMYIWGVTHFGTSWDYVLTDIKIELEG